jgi:hypothetical protein
MTRAFRDHFSLIRWAIALFTLAVGFVAMEPGHAAEEKPGNRNKRLRAETSDGNGVIIAVESVIQRHESGRNVFVFKATNRSKRKLRFKAAGHSATLDPGAEYEARLVSDSAGSEQPGELTYKVAGEPEAIGPLTYWSPE